MATEMNCGLYMFKDISE